MNLPFIPVSGKFVSTDTQEELICVDIREIAIMSLSPRNSTVYKCPATYRVILKSGREFYVTHERGEKLENAWTHMIANGF